MSWSITGPPRFLGNPSCTFAPVSDPGRVGPASPFDGYPMLSALKWTIRTPTTRIISWLNNAASVLAVYASSSALLHSHARLASGWWLAFTGRDSNPMNSNKRFQFNLSHFLLLQIYPGATTLDSHEPSCGSMRVTQRESSVGQLGTCSARTGATRHAAIGSSSAAVLRTVHCAIRRASPG